MGIIMRRMLAKKNGKKGFTLVEVIVVLVILAILAAIAIPALTGYIDKANEKKYISEMHTARTAMQTLISENYGEGWVISSTPMDHSVSPDGVLWGFYDGSSQDPQYRLVEVKDPPASGDIWNSMTGLPAIGNLGGGDDVIYQAIVDKDTLQILGFVMVHFDSSGNVVSGASTWNASFEHHTSFDGASILNPDDTGYRFYTPEELAEVLA
jgi:prepilin-type N-terminal cleavage/methylation domain-containing protein